MQVIYLR